MAVQIQLRKDSATNWASYNPVLAEGEPGFDLTNNALRIGDGLTPWSGLDEISGDGGGGGGGPVTIADLPAGSVLDTFQASNGTWPTRPTNRTDIRVNWIGYPDNTTPPTGATAGIDSYTYRGTP